MLSDREAVSPCRRHQVQDASCLFGNEVLEAQVPGRVRSCSSVCLTERQACAF